MNLIGFNESESKGLAWFRKVGTVTTVPEVSSGEEDRKGSYRALLQSNTTIASIGDDQDISGISTGRDAVIRRYLTYFFKVLIIVSAVWGLFVVTNNTFQHIRGPRSCSCGGIDVAEAKRRNCVFTPLALGWLPPHCLDLELSDQFDRLGPLPGGEWPYWADLNGTTRITREEMGNLADKGGLFFTTQEWHVMHCMFTWRKQYRSKSTGKTVENRSNGIKHIHHCEGIMLDRAPLQAIWTMAGVELNADLT